MKHRQGKRLSRDEITRTVLSLNEFELAHMFANFSREALIDVFQGLTPQDAKRIIAQVPPELTVPFLASLDPKEAERILGPPNPALEADLREAVDGLDFASVEELNATLSSHFAKKNAQPLEAFCGLSPEQMRYVLERPFEAPQIAEFVDPLAVDPDSPATLLFSMLVKAIGAEGLKPTAKGNLPIAVCMEAQAKMNAGFPSLRYLNDRRPRSEEDVPELHMLHQAARVGGFVRTVRGRIVLGSEARRLLELDGLRAIYPALMRSFAERFNWGFMDGYPEFPFLQQSFLFPLYLLHLHGGDWQTEGFYRDLFVRAFPTVLDGIEPDSYRTPVETVDQILTWRVFVHFFRFFGLVDMEYIPGPNFRGHYRIRSLPLFREVVRWKVG